MQFDSHGNLNGGIIKSNINDLKVNLVDSFNTSKTRERNFNSLLELIELLRSNNLLNGVTSIWIDGSFCTKKMDPRDIDLIILLKPYNECARTIEQNNEAIREFFIDKYLDIYIAYDSKCLADSNYVKQIMPDLKTDNPTYNEDDIEKILYENNQKIDHQMKYWMGQFGFDRKQRSKGLISLEGGSL